jgi:D-galactarolactone cycloisomerase
MQRRSILKALGTGVFAAAVSPAWSRPPTGSDPRSRLRAIAEAPVLRRELIRDPVIVQTVDLLEVGKQFVVRVRDRAGAQGMALCNPRLMRTLRPIFLERIAPFFVGKDARDLHATQDALLGNQLNYKWAGLPFWSPHAWMELALLDLLGNRAGLPVWRLLGDPVRRETGLYYASGDRTSSAEQVVDELRGFMAETGTRAVKFRLGARLKTTPFSDARDAKLIPLARKALGDDAVLYADANSSYQVPQALRVGRMLSELNYGYFEEPVWFEDFAETKQVNDALPIIIAGGEQESSLRRFETMIADRVVDLVQPDILYFGGLTRAIRVARMAAAAGMKAVPHISGDGLGFLNVLHFAAVVPNTTDYQEYKGDEDVPHVVTGTGKPLQPVAGKLAIPQGPGLGVTIDPEWLARGRVVTA